MMITADLRRKQIYTIDTNAIPIISVTTTNPLADRSLMTLATSHHVSLLQRRSWPVVIRIVNPLYVFHPLSHFQQYLNVACKLRHQSMLRY